MRSWLCARKLTRSGGILKRTAGDMVLGRPVFGVRKADIVRRSGVPIRIMRPMFGGPRLSRVGVPKLRSEGLVDQDDRVALRRRGLRLL